MGVRFFKILDYVLRQGIANICRVRRISEDQAIIEAREYLMANSAEYYRDDPCLQYNDPFCRIAYLYAYVGAHANLMDNAFYVFPELRDFVRQLVHNSGSLTVCSLGGGPGAELLGFVKFIERERESNDLVDLSFVLIDNVPEWDETWYALVNGLEQAFKDTYGGVRRTWPVIVNRSFLSLDLTRADDFRQFIGRFGDVHIYVLNHTVSELMAHADRFAEVFEVIVDKASDGTYFLVIDRSQAEVSGLADRLLQSCGLVNLGAREEKKNMDGDEQKTDLGEWYLRMDRDPKLRWNAFYALAQKMELEF